MAVLQVVMGMIMWCLGKCSFDLLFLDEASRIQGFEEFVIFNSDVI